MSPEYRVILERMRSSAGVVRRAVEAAPPGRFAQSPREGEWSALETLTHLRDVVVHVYGLRIRRLLYEETPVFADFDEEGYRRASLARSEVVGGLLDTIVAEHEQPGLATNFTSAGACLAPPAADVAQRPPSKTLVPLTED